MPRVARFLLVALCLLLQARPGWGHTPFLDATGLLAPDLRYSTVVAALGLPPQSEVEREVTDGGKVHGGNWWVAYPAQGLALAIPRSERTQADPRIDILLVRRPWTPTPDGKIHSGLAATWAARAAEPASSPSPWPSPSNAPGLMLGLSAADARQRAAVRHRVLPSPSPQSERTLHLAALNDRGDPPARTLTVHLRDDRVVGLDYRRTPASTSPLWRRSGAAAVVLLALTIHLRLARWRPGWVARAKEIDAGQPEVRGRALWPMRAVGGALVLLGGWLWFSHAGAPGGPHVAVVAFDGPLAQASGVVLGAFGLVLCGVPRLRYQPMQQLVGTLWVAALLAAAALAGLLPQWPLR